MISEKIRSLRKAVGYTQLQVAKLLQVSRTGYASWEQGLAEPSSTDIKKLCVLYEISADELLEIDTISKRKQIAISNSLNNNSGKINIKF